MVTQSVPVRSSVARECGILGKQFSPASAVDGIR